MKSIIFAIAVVLLYEMQATGQAHFIFLPDIYGKSIDGLGVFKVQNSSGADLTGNAIISVHENHSNTDVVKIKTPLITITPGIYNLAPNLFVRSSFIFSSNSLAGIISQTRSFPPGEYTFCYSFIPDGSHGTDEFEDCFDAMVEPLLPISLIAPSDKDTSCQTRPVLSWQPPMPFNTMMRFRLLLTEKRKGESIESLFTNSPLVLLNNISSTWINYPTASPSLKEGRTYCWQVVAYQQGIILSTSEIWDFTIKCKEADPKKPNDSYRELKLLVNGNYYIANDFLKFSFKNNYNVKKLNYSIIDIGNGFNAVKNIPEVRINQGLNNIDIDLTELNLENDKQYLLKVYPFNEPGVEVRFIYKENEK